MRSSSASIETQSDGSAQTEEEEEDEKKRSCNLFIYCENDESQIELLPSEFKFVEFDAWVRSRFGLLPHVKLQYCNEHKRGFYI